MRIRIPTINWYRIDSAFILFCLIWSYQLFGFFRGICLHLPGIKLIAPYIYPVLIVFFTLLSLPQILRKVRKVDLLFFLFGLIIYTSTFLFFPDNTESLLKYIPVFIFTALPCFFLGIILEEKCYEKSFYLLSLLTIFAMAGYYLVFVQASNYSGSFGEDAVNDNMAAAYGILPHLLLVIWMTLRKMNLLNVCMSIGGFFVLFTFGTRGPLLLSSLFILYYLFFEKKSKNKFLILILLLALVVIVFIYLDYILFFLYRLSSDMGMSVRIIEKIATDELTYSAGRNALYGETIQRILDGGIFGYGIRGISSFSTAPYTHNLLLDFWLDFGILFGSIYIILMLILYVLGWKNAKNEGERTCLVFLLIMGPLHLMLSHTYLTCGYLFCSFGYCLYLIRHSHSIHDTKQSKSF
ncbi:O-antigen ligase family protein [Phocaeicola abscessus]|uniref:O-antigen ligase family protein n=1 Tax=Phocaeicola abscessus TaxID=555313 RepID=UPI0028E47E8A|nr:O-antigen ligase family protein [Phocaeicola abscessus]